MAHKLSFRLGEAERLIGVADSSVDRILAIECAFYFDRPRFYRRAAQVLKPDGLVVLADIAIADRAAFLARRAEDLRRVGTQSSNRTEWERHFRTRSVCRINNRTRPGAQMTVWQIPKTAPVLAPERRRTPRVDEDGVLFSARGAWLVGQLHPIRSDRGPEEVVRRWFIRRLNVPNRRSHIVLMPKFTTCRW